MTFRLAALHRAWSCAPTLHVGAVEHCSDAVPWAHGSCLLTQEADMGTLLCGPGRRSEHYTLTGGHPES